MELCLAAGHPAPAMAALVSWSSAHPPPPPSADLSAPRALAVCRAGAGAVGAVGAPLPAAVPARRDLRLHVQLHAGLPRAREGRADGAAETQSLP